MTFFTSLPSFAHKRPCFSEWVRYFSAARPRGDPLRILFCGSDGFSCASLEALDHDRRRNGSTIIESVDVVCRPPKPYGRGLKQFRSVPIQAFAQNLHLPLHQIDTFSGWQLPPHINLIVAVSFGLFVPPRILKSAKYGGLNIHPSMLPDLRGPAPIHHALLRRRAFTGVTLQTLHPSKFDHGTVLAQTPFPGLPIIPRTTPEQLTEPLAGLGAKLLVDALNARLHEPPLKGMAMSEQQINSITSGQGIAHAPKISPKDREIAWSTMSTGEILHRDHVLGRLWDTTTYSAVAQDPTCKTRVIFSQGFQEDTALSERFTKVAGEMRLPPGTPIILHDRRTSIAITTIDGIVVVKGCTVENGQKNEGVRELVRLNERVELEKTGTGPLEGAEI